MGLALALGCGDTSGLSKRYPVSGTVKYNGQPVEKGTINFVPTAADGRPATGDIASGSYTLTTATPGDGALPGSYKVVVISEDIDTTKLKEIAKGGQFHHDETFAKAVTSAKNRVPPKYKLPDTSDITAEVKAQTNSIPVELKD
jgi:hypothetical protein